VVRSQREGGRGKTGKVGGRERDRERESVWSRERETARESERGGGWQRDRENVCVAQGFTRVRASLVSRHNLNPLNPNPKP